MTIQFDANGMPIRPAVMPGEKVYEMIMSEIEPDLLPESIKGHQIKYANETPEETNLRGKRYTAAFVEYKKRYQAYINEKEEEMRRYRTALFAKVESLHNSHEHDALASLDLAISS